MSLRRNTLWNLAGTGLPLLIGAVTIPFLIRRVGVEAFGVLTLIWALIGYFSLFDFGLGRALTQQIASACASGQESRVPRLAKSGLAFTALTGCVGGILLGFFQLVVERRSDGLKFFLLGFLGLLRLFERGGLFFFQRCFLGGEIFVHYRFGIGQGFCLLGFFLVPGGTGLELFLLERFARCLLFLG